MLGKTLLVFILLGFVIYPIITIAEKNGSKVISPSKEKELRKTSIIVANTEDAVITSISHYS